MTKRTCSTCVHEPKSLAEVPCNSCSSSFGNWESREDVKATNVQVGGSHYQSPIQPVDFIVKNNIKWREANVIKYVFRHEKKNGVEDLKKARHYLDMLIEDYK